jgi:hypothetical protein
MRAIYPLSLLVGVVLAVPFSVGAQMKPWIDPPPVMRIECEEIKPGLYQPHVELEETAPPMAAKWKLPWYSIAIESETRPDEACYLIPFKSFADWQDDDRFLDENPGFNKEDAEWRQKENAFVSRYHDVAIMYEENLSYRPVFNMEKMRYVMVFKIRVRPGHDSDFQEARKIYLAAHAKAKVDEHMIVYWVLAGEPMDTYLVFLPMRSLAEIDESAAKHGKAYEDAIRDGDKRMRELESVAIESSEITI